MASYTQCHSRRGAVFLQTQSLGENAATRWSLNGMTAPSVCDVLDQNYRQGCILEDGQPCSCCWQDGRPIRNPFLVQILFITRRLSSRETNGSCWGWHWQTAQFDSSNASPWIAPGPSVTSDTCPQSLMALSAFSSALCALPHQTLRLQCWPHQTLRFVNSARRQRFPIAD